MLGDLTNTAYLQRLARAKAKAQIQQIRWPERHVVGKDGQPVPFHAAQELVWNSERRITALVSGSQLGKSHLMPWWLKREIERMGKGDYLAVTSSFGLFDKKFLPQMLLVFENILGWGRFWAGSQIIELRDPVTGEFLANRSTDPMWGRIILGSAQSSGGLESTTAKAAVLDEVGQPEFTIQAWRAVLRRLSISRGRILLASTLYGLGWIIPEVITPALKSGITKTIDLENGASIDYTDDEKNNIVLVQADSIVNPEFQREEYDEMKAKMPPDEFAMFYRGRVTKPRHLIYDCLDDELHVIPPFKIPENWQRYVGLDFGAVNTVATFWAEEPKSKKLYCYREYHLGGRNAREHIDNMLSGEPMVPLVYGGAQAEGQWRKEFRDGGLSVKQPKIADVWLGVNICYSEIKDNNIFIFDGCEGLIKDLSNYRRKYDGSGNPTDEIYEKNTYHFVDSMRYLISSIRTRRNALVAFA